MICPNCGKQISDEAKFCPYCGKAAVLPESHEEQPNISEMVRTMSEESDREQFEDVTQPAYSEASEDATVPVDFAAENDSQAETGDV